MQTQSACLTSFVVFSEAVTSLAWPVIFEFQRTKVHVGNALWLFYDFLNLRISHPRTRFSKCISADWNHLLEDIWCWREKIVQEHFPFLDKDPLTLRRNAVLSLCFPLYFLSSYSLWQLPFRHIYVTINIGASWSSELCLEAFSSVYFSSFLIQVMILSFSGTRKHKRFFYLSVKLFFRSKQGETSFPLRKRLQWGCFWICRRRQ